MFVLLAFLPPFVSVRFFCSSPCCVFTFAIARNELRVSLSAVCTGELRLQGCVDVRASVCAHVAGRCISLSSSRSTNCRREGML